LGARGHVFGYTYAFRHLSGAYRVCHSEQELSTPARGAAGAKAPPPSNTPNQNHPSSVLVRTHYTTPRCTRTAAAMLTGGGTADSEQQREQQHEMAR
jgi:hypothetical protein